MGAQMYKSTLLKLSSIVFCLLFANSVYAGITDGKFTTAQTWDVQWYISSGTLNASNFNNLYVSVNYTTQTSSAHRLTDTQQADLSANGRYLQFFESTTNSGTYGLASYNSNGTLYKVLHNTGSFRALADGAIFYNGNGFWGTLITLDEGYYKYDSDSFPVEINYPTNTQLANYTYDSTEPLAAGETASAPAAPTPVYSSGITQSQSTKRTSKLADTAAHGMEAHVNITGGSNTVYIDQHDAAQYLELTIIGNSNTVDIDQSDPTGVGTHFSDIVVDGNSNALDIKQQGTGSKTAFIGIDGNSNIANINQKDSGSHYLQLDLIGDGHTATILQEGSGSHEATVELSNGGGSWDFDLHQQGSTSKEYSLPHNMSDGSTTSGTCYVSAGCSLTVIQSD